MNVEKAMIVDDCESDQYLTKMEIKEFDPTIEVVQAYDGREALDELDSTDNPPDVIFLDINMPGMNGLEFLREYEKRDSQSTVIAMLTSSAQEIDKQAALQYDFVQRYYMKLLVSDELEEMFGDLPEPA